MQMRGICRSDACGNDAAAHLDGGQNVGGVGALAALRANQAAGDGHGEQRVQQFMLRVPVHEPGPELAQDGAVEARVVERQGQQVLPIQSGSHRVGGVAIRQVLGELEQGDERQPPRCFGRAAARGEQPSKTGVVEDGPKAVAHIHQQAAAGKRCPGNLGRFLGHGSGRAGAKGHGWRPSKGGKPSSTRAALHHPKPPSISPAVSGMRMDQYSPGTDTAGRPVPGRFADIENRTISIEAKWDRSSPGCRCPSGASQPGDDWGTGVHAGYRSVTGTARRQGQSAWTAIHDLGGETFVVA